jgi:alkylated DNA repair protein (DNA oxidative demethylase)
MRSGTTSSLFAADEPALEPLCPGATLLRGFALPMAADLVAAVEAITRVAPFRHLLTPGGFRMSVAMSNCGRLGWVSDRRGYRYDPLDPLRGEAWPPMPGLFATLATGAAASAGFAGFQPEACLVNCYVPGARLTLHQDRDERNYDQPIVSVSLGLPAVFQFGGLQRSDRCRRVPLEHGDVLVWGGPARLFHHGILPLKDGHHPMLGARRINLTFRRAT